MSKLKPSYGCDEKIITTSLWLTKYKQQDLLIRRSLSFGGHGFGCSRPNSWMQKPWSEGVCVSSFTLDPDRGLVSAREQTTYAVSCLKKAPLSSWICANCSYLVGFKSCFGLNCIV